MRTASPPLRTLREAVRDFGAAGPDASWRALLDATAPAIDLSRAGHQQAVLRWLNAWGCRIRYARPGESDVTGTGLRRWWAAWAGSLPPVGVTLAELTDPVIDGLGPAYAALVAVAVSGPPRVRGLGATAASKLLYALRPAALMPWDAAIAQALHGGRDAAAYVAHQRLGRDWASGVLAEAGLDEPGLAASLGRPDRTLAKMLDDYCYLAFTRGTAWIGRPR
jgi:hypothetical protein